MSNPISDPGLTRRFQKKQVEVEAVLWTGGNLEQVRGLGLQFTEARADGHGRLYVGSRSLGIGDYLVVEANGAFEVYGPSDFAAIYEPAALSAPAPEHSGEGKSSGVELIAAERRRQVEAEGWTPEHDDRHDNGELAEAAAAYALGAGDHLTETAKAEAASFWPFADGWKPSDDEPIRDLTKAGALIAAEIDRLQRTES